MNLKEFVLQDRNIYKSKILTIIMASTHALVFWFIGSACIFFGALLAGSVEPGVLGATLGSVIIAYIIAFILILIGGMFWISIPSIEEE